MSAPLAIPPYAHSSDADREARRQRINSLLDNIDIDEGALSDRNVLATSHGSYTSLVDIFERLISLTRDLEFSDCTVTLTPDTGKYREILRQQPDGTWRYSRTVWTREDA